MTSSDKCRSDSSTVSLNSLVSVVPDDSDSEIFRVKRRSPIGRERKKDDSKAHVHRVHFYYFGPLLMPACLFIVLFPNNFEIYVLSLEYLVICGLDLPSLLTNFAFLFN